MKKTTNPYDCLGKFLKLCKRLCMCAVVLFLFLPSAMAGQKEQNKVIDVNYKDASLEQVFEDLQAKTSMNYIYSSADVKKYGTVTYSKSKIPFTKVLDDVLKDTALEYKIEASVVVILPKKAEEPKVKKDIEKKEITGKVVDEKGNPMPGVAVVVQGTKFGTATDARGRFKIKASEKDALTFTFIGYKDQIILIKDQKKVEVQMFPKTETLEEVSVVAFGEQKKESVVASITTVKAEDLESSNNDLTSQFAGKIAGLIGWQTGGKPGALTEEEMNTKFYIRGITSYQTGANIDPLILLDGIEVSKLDLARIDPDDIESFNVMKDAAATAMYGARGANGVIYVKTKKGKEGNVRTTFRFAKVWSKPTRKIDVVGPREYMNLYNKTIIDRGYSETPIYTKEQIDNTGSDKYPSWVYPNNDWYDILFKDVTSNEQYALNVRGGGKIIQYYASLAHNNSKGMIKTDKLNDFSCNIENKQTNFQVNVNINLNKTAKLILNSFSTYDNYHGPQYNVRQAYAIAFGSSPVDFAPVYSADEDSNWPHIRFGAGGSGSNPYALIQKGYQDRIRFSSVNKFEYIQNLSRLLSGLELRASVALSKSGYFVNEYYYRPFYYSLQNYDVATGKHKLTLVDKSADDKLRKGSGFTEEKNSATTMDYNLTLLHSAAWGDHTTSMTGVFSARQKDDSTPSSITQSLPYRKINIAGRASYGYKDRYFVEASCGINGSERFAKGNRIGYFPAVGTAWILTKEDFMRSVSSWLNFAKVRLSYGLTGNDGVINDPRFLYLENVEKDGGVSYGEPLDNHKFYNINSYPNKDTKWETAEQMNLGFEMKILNGLFDFNVDVYQEIRRNIYDYRIHIPSSMGLVNPQLDNIGKVKSRGLDFSGKIQHAFSSDFWFLLNGTFTYNKATYEYIEEPTGKALWQKKIGHDISQQYCYIAEGLFQDQEEIDNAPHQDGEIQPGDIRYKDVDGDNQITINDAVMVGFPETPRIIYGFNGFVHYKGFEFSFAFQGSGQRSFFINPASISPFYFNQACLRKIADDHWTPENQKSKPFWPKLSVKSIVEHNPQEGYYGNSEVRKSTYFMREGKFIRCRSLQLGYTFNKKLLEKTKIQNCKIYASIENPFIISDFDLWDVELGENGFNYPIQKTFALGLNITF